MLLASLLLLLSQGPPDILVIVADDLAESDFERIATPNLDFLASQGMRFRRAYGHPVCAATRATVHFGEWRGTHHKSACFPRKPNHPLDPPDYNPGAPSLPKVVAGQGYETALFGKWHLGRNELTAWELTPNLLGFSTWASGSMATTKACEGEGFYEWIRVDDGMSALSYDYNTAAIRDEFLLWWGAGSCPRFGWVSFNAPHLPLHVPPADMLPPGRWSDPTDRQKYELTVYALDLAVGQMLAQVDLSQTLVVFFADNGTPAEVPRPDQDPAKMKTTTFEDGIRVPLIFAGPGVARGESQALVSVVDLFRTLALFSGACVDDLGPASKDLTPLLRGEDVEVREFIYAEHTRPGTLSDRAVVEGAYKLRQVSTFPQEAEELYDLAADPAESNPLDLTDPALAEVLAKLRARLEDPN